MKQILCTNLSPCGRHEIDCHTHEPTFLFHVWIAELPSCSVMVKDTTRLMLFQKAGSFPQRQLVCLCLSLCVVVTDVIVVGSATWSLAVFRPMTRCLQQFLHVLMCALLVLPLLFVRCLFWFWCLTLPFSESRLASCCHHPHLFHFHLTRSNSLQSFGKRNTVATKLFEQRHCWRLSPTASCS